MRLVSSDMTEGDKKGGEETRNEGRGRRGDRE
jgi:hypothetical protein